jgi:drug/metabolite transporter (DMT)-like permease
VAGLVWGLASAVALAFYSIQPARLLKRYNTGTLVGYAMLIAGLTFSTVSRPWDVPGE